MVRKDRSRRGRRGRRGLSVLVHLGLEPLLDLGLLLGLLPYGSQLPLEPLLGPDDLALQVEAPALLGVVGVEEALVPLEHLLDVGLPAGRGLDVEDAAGLVEGHARRERGRGAAPAAASAGFALRALVGRRGRGLLVGGDEGAAEDSGACDEGCDDELVRLREKERKELYVSINAANIFLPLTIFSLFSWSHSFVLCFFFFPCSTIMGRRGSRKRLPRDSKVQRRGEGGGRAYHFSSISLDDLELACISISKKGPRLLSLRPYLVGGRRVGG